MQVCFRQGLHSSQRAIMVSLHTSGNAFNFISVSLVSSRASFRKITRPGEPHRDLAGLPGLWTTCYCCLHFCSSPEALIFALAHMSCCPCWALSSLLPFKYQLLPKLSLTSLTRCSDSLFLRLHLSLTPHFLFSSPQRPSVTFLL